MAKNENESVILAEKQGNSARHNSIHACKHLPSPPESTACRKALFPAEDIAVLPRYIAVSNLITRRCNNRHKDKLILSI